ncbi:hypothetical protein [Mycolicibacterium llatzerense]|uniref:hypothetical protein n=1 Tax=Mycolicibacterium llatzerense TaxID=280871 RepID=UPI0021B5CA67|nr:hypothetical protein [Mycolicibacterium llatzerense]
MWTALWFLKRWPKQIEYDLADKDRSILRDWHRGTRDKRGRLKVTSRELLVLIEYLPDDGAFKMALQGREGDWDEKTQILAGIHEELSMYHASKCGQDMAKVFLSPKARMEALLQQAEEEQDAADAEDAIDEWFG